MTRRALCLVLTGLVLTGAVAAEAAEPYQKFLDGLRERRYYDQALLYLDQIAADPKISADIRQAVPFEKAITLIQQSRIVRKPEQQTQLLDRAETALEQFVTAHPEHPRAGQAHTERGQILLGRARVAVYQSKSPANEGRRPELQKQARDLISRARAIFQAAHDQHKAAYEKFPRFIDRDGEKEQYEERAQAEVRYIRAQLDLALCTYEETQTYDKRAPEFKDLLTRASLQFETIHTRYRSMVGGLYARMWQGKCFEEQDDLRKALGIYDEVLRHPGTSQAMRTLQDQALQFRLICLNHEQRKDYQLVIDQASEWLDPAGSRSKIGDWLTPRSMYEQRVRTPVGLGIRWERARANEQMSLRREISKQERDRYLRAALTDARQINQFDGQYKDVSLLMVQRLQFALRRDAGDPKEFHGAIGLSRGLVKEIRGFTEAIAAAKKANQPKAKIDELEQDLQNHLNETGRILRLALSLSDEHTEPVQVDTARYLLSYIYFLSKRSYEAALLGEFVGSRFHDQEDHRPLALDATHIALAAWQQAYYADPDREDREFELNQLERVGTLITTRWPHSDKAHEARLLLGTLYRQRKDWKKAAEWYNAIPETAVQFARAQAAVGELHWTTYREAFALPRRERPSREQLQSWRDAAGLRMSAAAIQMQRELPSGAARAGMGELFSLRLMLAEWALEMDRPAEAITWLTGSPHALIEPFSAAAQLAAPPREVEAADPKITAGAYDLLLRTYVGFGRIEHALKLLEHLEKRTDDEPDMMPIFNRLSRQIESGMARAQHMGEPELADKLAVGLGGFLAVLLEENESPPAALLVWIADTHGRLGEAAESDEVAQTRFARGAAVYRRVVERAEADAGFLDASRFRETKLHLARCLRRAGDFDAAFEQAARLLVAHPEAADLRGEAAALLCEWTAAKLDGGMLPGVLRELGRLVEPPSDRSP